LLGGAYQGGAHAAAFRVAGHHQDADVTVPLEGEVVLLVLEEDEPTGLPFEVGNQQRLRTGSIEKGPQRPRFAFDDLLAGAPRRRAERGQPDDRLEHEFTIAGMHAAYADRLSISHRALQGCVAAPLAPAPPGYDSSCS
jgi:hypothetical protein